MQMKTVTVIGILCACSVAVLAGMWYYAFSGPGPQGPPDDVSVGFLSDESSGLVFIADEKGFFTTHGLNLSLTRYPNGATAIQAMKNGEVNLTLSSEFPLVAEIIGGQDIVIAGAVDKYYGTAIVAHRDRGILNPSDLRGKTISMSKNSIGEFYLGRFLDLHGIRLREINITDRPPDTFMTDMSGNSTIDAAVVTSQNAWLLLSQPGNQYITFPAESNQATYKVVAGKRDWVERNPRAMARFLQALDEASQFAVTYPGEAQAVVRKHLNSTDDRIRSVWPEHDYSLTLDQSIILAMEDEARWMVRNNLTRATSVPNFLDHISTRGMESVKPGAVTIIRRSERS